MGHPGVPGWTGAQVLAVANYSEATVGNPSHHFYRPVGGAIIHHNYLKIIEILGEATGQSPQNKFFPVIHWDNNAKVRFRFFHKD